MSVLTRSKSAIQTQSVGELPAGTCVVKDVYLFDIGMLAAMVREHLCWIDETSMTDAIDKTNEIYVQMPSVRSETDIVGGLRIHLNYLSGVLLRPWVAGSRVYGDLHILSNVNGSTLYQMFRDGIDLMFKPYCKSGNLADVVERPGQVDIEIDHIVYLTPIVPTQKAELQPIYVERG